MIFASLADILIFFWLRSRGVKNPPRDRVSVDVFRSIRWLSAGALVDSWQRMGRDTGQIQIPDHVAERDGLDFTWPGISELNHVRPDVRVSHVLHFVANRTTHIFLAWRAAAFLLVLSLPVVCAAAPPPVSQIGPDTDGGFRLVDPAGPSKPIIPIELPSELPPPRPDLAQSRGPTVPVDLIHQTLIDLLQLPATEDAPGTPEIREVIINTMPPQDGRCPPCEFTRRELAPGLPGVKFTWVVGGATAYPTIRMADRPTYVNADGQTVPLFFQQGLTRGQMVGILQQYPAPQTVGTVTLGSIKGKAQVAQALNLLNEMGPGQLSLSWQVAHAPKLGTADGGLEVDGAGSMTYRWDADQMRLMFKPSLRLVSKTWVGRVSQPVSGVLVDRDRLTIEMPGMIDLAKRLVE